MMAHGPYRPGVARRGLRPRIQPGADRRLVPIHSSGGRGDDWPQGNHDNGWCCLRVVQRNCQTGDGNLPWHDDAQPQDRVSKCRKSTEEGGDPVVRVSERHRIHVFSRRADWGLDGGLSAATETVRDRAGEDAQGDAQ